jgi:hypothetical protein
MLKRLLLLALLLAALGPRTGDAQAAGGNYVFDGGTAYERSQVKQALAASAFPWSVVTTQVVVHVGRGLESSAAPGEIWLDANLLDAGEFSWGVVQHEYAHQVDFLLLGEETRLLLATRLDAATWYGVEGTAHDDLGCERFASTLAWAYWQSPRNSMKPDSANDESAALKPAAFRALLATVLARPELPTAR